MKENTPWNSIVKYLRKEATPEEITELNLWLEEDKENKKLLAEAFDVFAVSGSLPQPIAPDQGKAWQKINRKITTSPKIHPAKFGFENIRTTAAAVAILLIGFSALWMTNRAHYNQILCQQTEIVSPSGQKSKIVLPDSSVVWLNSGSSLKYKGNFNRKEREVVLEGEAYFEVAKNKSKKFRVKTRNSLRRCLRNSFQCKKLRQRRISGNYRERRPRGNFWQNRRNQTVDPGRASYSE